MRRFLFSLLALVALPLPARAQISVAEYAARRDSLAAHIGNGVFGGLLPLIGVTVVARTGDIYAGLYYPIAVALVTFVVGSLLLRETHNTLIWDETR